MTPENGVAPFQVSEWRIETRQGSCGSFPAERKFRMINIAPNKKRYNRSYHRLLSSRKHGIGRVQKDFILSCKLLFTEQDFLPLLSSSDSLLKIHQVKIIHRSSWKECYFAYGWTSLWEPFFPRCVAKTFFYLHSSYHVPPKRNLSIHHSPKPRRAQSGQCCRNQAAFIDMHVSLPSYLLDTEYYWCHSSFKQNTSDFLIVVTPFLPTIL